MKKLIVVVVIVVAAVYAKERLLNKKVEPAAGAKTEGDSQSVQQARKRLESMMRAWKQGPGTIGELTAGCQWARGYDKVADGEDRKDIVLAFYDWRKEKGLIDEIDYQIHDYKWVEDHTVARLTINGKDLAVAIPDLANPMRWVN